MWDGFLGEEREDEFKEVQTELLLEDDWRAVFDKYILIKRVGHGSMGHIIKAKIRETGQSVAIKRISRLDDNVDLYRGLAREVSILRQLSKMPENNFSIKLLDAVASEDFNKVSTSFLFLI